MAVRPPGDNIDYGDAPDDAATGNPAAAKSRGIGVLLLALGAAAVAAGVFLGIPSQKVTMALTGLGTVGVVMGIGMVLFPWTPEMFELNKQDDFGKMFKAMPVIWKVWFVFSLAAILAAAFAPVALR
jgi:hypothetical protein